VLSKRRVCRIGIQHCGHGRQNQILILSIKSGSGYTSKVFPGFVL